MLLYISLEVRGPIDLLVGHPQHGRNLATIETLLWDENDADAGPQVVAGVYRVSPH